MDVVGLAASSPTVLTSAPMPEREPVAAEPAASRAFAEARPNGTNAYGVPVLGPAQISVVDVTLTRNGREDRDLRAVERLDVTFRKWPGTVPVIVRLVQANGTSVAIAASHRVEPCRDLIEALQREVGFEQVRIRGGDPSSDASSEATPWGGRASA
jgi:hypothetical protein